MHMQKALRAIQRNCIILYVADTLTDSVEYGFFWNILFKIVKEYLSLLLAIKPLTVLCEVKFTDFL